MAVREAGFVARVSPSPRSDSLPERLTIGDGHLTSMPVPSPGPVGGRLNVFVNAWRRANISDNLVLSWLGEGLTFRWLDQKPPVRQHPWFFPTPSDQEKYDRLAKEVSDLVAKHAIERVTDHVGFYALIFLVPKKTGGWRPVFDLSQLNEFLVIPKFKMETPIAVQRSLQQGMWAVSIDIKDAYLHVPIHPHYRRYLKFAFEGAVYQFRVLPFGVSTAPYVFTRTVRAMAARFRAMGIQFHYYIDDWLVVADSRERVLDHARKVLGLVLALGWIPNWDKSHLTPCQTLQYIGVQFDLRRGLALPPQDRILKARALLDLVVDNPVTTARSALSLLGVLASMEKQVPYGRCFLRPIQWSLATQWRIVSDPLDREIRFSQQAIEACRWWMDDRNLLRGMPLEEYVPHQTFFSDASQVAWGAHMDDRQLSGRWSGQDLGLHINVLELKAVTRAFFRWGSHSPPGTRWLVFTDNTTVVAHVNKQGGTRSRDLCQEAEKLIRFAFQHQIFIRARHLPGKRNVLADALSRPDRVLGTEWSLSPRIFDRICQVFGRPQIDLFATSLNAKLPTFFSPLPESRALAADAMSQSWDGMFAYAYPPTGFVTEVLHKIQRSRCEVLLVAPCWPTQQWFPLLLSLLIDLPRELPISQSLLRQPGTSIFHHAPQVLKLHVWRLSNNPSSRQVFLERCPNICPRKTVSLPDGHMKLSGESSFVGVTEGMLIRSQPL